MVTKRNRPEEIVADLRQLGVPVGQGQQDYHQSSPKK